MGRSLRLFGNGGLFCSAGWFRNRTLGRYRAFAMSPRHAVVLTFAARVVAVTPDDPERILRALEGVVQQVPAARC